jgi:hypothetical protein
MALENTPVDTTMYSSNPHLKALRYVCFSNHRFARLINAVLVKPAKELLLWAVFLRADNKDNGGQTVLFGDIAYISQSLKMHGVPHFLYCHSMGGAMGLKYSSINQDEFNGVIASGLDIGLPPGSLIVNGKANPTKWYETLGAWKRR